MQPGIAAESRRPSVRTLRIDAEVDLRKDVVHGLQRRQPLLVDLEGTVYQHGRLIPGAVEALAAVYRNVTTVADGLGEAELGLRCGVAVPPDVARAGGEGYRRTGEATATRRYPACAMEE